MLQGQHARYRLEAQAVRIRLLSSIAPLLRPPEESRAETSWGPLTVLVQAPVTVRFSIEYELFIPAPEKRQF